MAVRVGEAAVRIVPTLRGFHNRVRSELKRQPHHIDVRVDPDFGYANTQMEAWRQLQSKRPLEVPVRTDLAGLKKDLGQVEHIFKRSSVSRALRLNVKIIGLDALPALAYAAGSATAGIDALGKSLLALPGISAGALGSVAALATGLKGIGAAFQESEKAAKDHEDNLKKVQEAQRDLARAHRDLNQAIRDQKREIQDLNMEIRRASLDEADAILNIQEAADRLRQGGFKSITEFQRAQLQFLRSVDDLHQLRARNSRLMEDTMLANQRGIEGSERVITALDGIADALDRLNEAQKEAANTGMGGEAMAKLSANAQNFVNAVKSMESAWTDMQKVVQDHLFAGLDQEFVNFSNRMIPGLQVGLSRVASGWNTNIRELFQTLSSQTTQGFLEDIFRNSEAGLNRMRDGIQPMIDGFMRMASVGSDFFPRLADAFERVMVRFNEWTIRIEQDGSLKRWIDEGLDALSSLGNATLDLFHVVRRISEAFGEAAGHGGGFITSLERGMERLARHLDQPHNFQAMVDYFRQARTFVTELWNAIKNMRPFISDLVDIARQWSSWMFSIVGSFTKLASWIERNTGLLAPLLATYMTLRTVRPIIDGLTTAWKNYNTIIGALARFRYTERIFGPIAQGAVIARGELDKFKQTTDASGKAVAGPQRGSMLNMAKGLALFLGPGAGFMLAVSSAMWGVHQLGEAHRQAAEQAKAQEEALKSLKSTLDEVTGSATMQTVADTTKSLQKFTIPGLEGEQNILEKAASIGIDPATLVKAASDPTQAPLFHNLIEGLAQQTAKDIEGDKGYQRWKEVYDKAGIDSLTLARAVFGDPEAKKKVDDLHALQSGIPQGAPQWMKDVGRWFQTTHGRLPSLTDLIEGSVAGQVGHALFKSQTTLGAGLQEQKQASAVASGSSKGWLLSPAAQGMFGAYAPDPQPDKSGTTHEGVITLNRRPRDEDIKSWEEQGISVEPLPNNRWEVTVPPNMADTMLIPKMAQGGLIGGVGTGTSDSNLAWLSKGEFVARKAAVDYYGREFFDSLNGLRIPKFSIGGMVLPKKPWFPSPPPKPPSPPPLLTPQSVAAATPPPAPAAPHPQQLGPTLGVQGTPVQTPPGAFSSPKPPPPPPPRPEGLGAALDVKGTPVSGTPLIPGVHPSLKGPGVLGAQLGKQQISDLDFILMSHLGPGGWTNQPKPQSVDYKKWYPAQHSRPAAKPTAKSSTTATTTSTGKGGTPAGTPAPAVTGATHFGTGAFPGPTPHAGTGAFPGPTVVHPMQYTMASFVPGAMPMMAGLPMMPMLAPPAMAGMPLQDLGKGSEAGLQVNTIAVKRAVEALFPQIQEIGGVRQDALKWHPNGLALDIMIPGGTTRGGRNPQGKALGDQIYNFLKQNADALGVYMDGTLWQTDQGGDHFDHIHVATTGGGYPTGNEQYMLPGGSTPMPGMGPLSMFGPMLTPQLMQSTGLQFGPDGLPTSGQAMDPISEFFRSMGLDPSTPGLGHLAGDKVTDFLTNQMQNVGSQLLQIALGFVGGLTGLDFSSLVGHGQTIGNFVIGKVKDEFGGESTTPTSLNDMASMAMQNWTVGGLPLSTQGAFDPWLGADVSSLFVDPSNLAGQATAEDMADAGGNVAKWMPLVKAVVMRLYQAGLIKKGAPNEWVAAVMRQMKLESNGNPNAINLSDSNAAKGTPSKGLMQVIQPTFDRYFPQGLGFSGNIMDPASNIAAAILYTQDRYGGPHGMTGTRGYRKGGLIRGRAGRDAILARVSRGEFLANTRAVAHYGPDFFARLNALQIPREALPGFQSGMWWLPWQQQPQAAPSPPPGPAPQPAGPTPGPLPLSPPGAAPVPSTGGAPGPGAPAPAPDPGALPQVGVDSIAGAASAIGGGIGGAAPSVVQPGATPTPQGDPRATLGAPPTTQDHNHPALTKGIHGAAGAIGGLAGLAAQAAGSVGGVMSGNPALGQAGGAAAAGIQAGAQIGAGVVSGIANILSSLMVGTLTSGSTASASGVPLLPQRQQQQGVRVIQRVHNGDINVTNLDEFRRTQQRMDAQAMMPFIGKYEA